MEGRPWHGGEAGPDQTVLPIPPKTRPVGNKWEYRLSQVGVGYPLPASLAMRKGGGLGRLAPVGQKARLLHHVLPTSSKISMV